MGSSASLTEESLRRRPSHSRKASVESLDLDAPSADAGAHLAGGRPRRYNLPRRGSDEHLSASTVEASVASRAASGSSSAAPLAAGGVVADTDDEGEELTSTEKPLRPDAPDALSPTPSPSRPPSHPGPATIVSDPAARADRIRAVVAVGGYLVDPALGAPARRNTKAATSASSPSPADAPSATSPSSSTSSPKRTATTTKPPRPDPRARPERSARRPATPSFAPRGDPESSTKTPRTRPRASASRTITTWRRCSRSGRRRSRRERRAENCACTSWRSRLRRDDRGAEGPTGAGTHPRRRFGPEGAAREATTMARAARAARTRTRTPRTPTPRRRSCR